MNSLKQTRIVFAVLGLALALRVYHLNLPFLEPYNNITRQSVVAMMVRNFYQHGFQFFYPEIDLNGNGPSLFNAEMPVYSYLMAIAYWLVGGVQEWAARSVSVFFSLGTLLFLYGLIRRIYDARLALFALIFAAFSPMSVALSRSIQPDMTALFASVGAVYAFYEYHVSFKKRWWVFSTFFFWLAIANKAYTLHLAMPLLAIALKFQDPSVFRQAKNYAYALISLSALLWYAAMWYQGQSQPLYYSTIHYDRGPSYRYVWELFTLPYILQFAKIFFVHLLTLPGSLLFFAGFWPSSNDKKDRLFYAWFVSVLLYMLFFWRISIEHSYYQLPFVPPASFFVARGVIRILHHARWKALLTKVVFAIPFWTAVLVNTLYFYRGLYFLPERLWAVVEAGTAVNKLAPKNSLVIASFRPGSALLYYCARKGWEFDLLSKDESRLIANIEHFREKGASFFVTTDLETLNERRQFHHYLRTHFSVLQENDRFIIFKLQNNP